jgi:hypothetical protein
MITKDILIELLNTYYMWDILILFMNESKEHYDAIIAIYDQCKDVTKINTYLLLKRICWDLIYIIDGNTDEGIIYLWNDLLSIQDYIYMSYRMKGLFVARVSTYIMAEIVNGNVSPEVIEYIETLLKK